MLFWRGPWKPTCRATGEAATSFRPRFCMNPRPSDSRRLMIGPAKQAVMAMLLRPRLAMALLVDKSPTEFPHARTVIPSTS